MEVALIPMTGKPSLYPGLFLFTTPCRLVRPVQNLELGKEELIGTMEQVGACCSAACVEHSFQGLSSALKAFDRKSDRLFWLSGVLPRFREPEGGLGSHDCPSVLPSVLASLALGSVPVDETEASH